MVLLNKKYRLILLCCFLFGGCGIETVIYLQEPERLHVNSDLDNPSYQYCEFRTADSYNTGAVATYFRGSEIYYRIYAVESDCLQDIRSISDYNEKNPSAAARYLLDTKKYAALTISTVPQSLRPLIGAAAADRVVRFRLKTYGSDAAALTIGSTFRGVPYRKIGIQEGKLLFTHTNIELGDSDVAAPANAGTPSSWYVNFYAVSYGVNDNYSPIYSELEYLGYIKISAGP